MKKLLFALAALAVFTSANSQFNKIELSYWNAFDAAYMETASEDLLIDPGDIWGDFDTQFLELNYRKTFLRFFGVDIHARGGLIQPNYMYLYNENSYLTIGGGMIGGSANLMFAPIQKKDMGLAVYAGFSYTYTNKTFNDYTLILVIKPGEFGSYKASMFGPEVGILFDKTFLAGMLGLEANIFCNPLYENEVVLSGWTQEPTDDYAKGMRLGGSLFADFHFMKFYGGLGYRYEESYFGYSMNDKYDLGFHFSGIQLRAGMEL
ncbi:MAG: hypothetical protein ACOYXB_11560 [Bacteroidota bacterium]